MHAEPSSLYTADGTTHSYGVRSDASLMRQQEAQLGLLGCGTIIATNAVWPARFHERLLIPHASLGAFSEPKRTRFPSYMRRHFVLKLIFFVPDNDRPTMWVVPTFRLLINMRFRLSNRFKMERTHGLSIHRSVNRIDHYHTVVQDRAISYQADMYTSPCPPFPVSSSYVSKPCWRY